MGFRGRTVEMAKRNAGLYGLQVNNSSLNLPENHHYFLTSDMKVQ
eukprot:COSAG06_NODE_61633_length_267_cov_0.619048_1_plen_45_part_10